MQTEAGSCIPTVKVQQSLLLGNYSITDFYSMLLQ